MWGARSGVEQLPPFPEPSHDAVKRRHHVPAYVKDLCVVDFQTLRSRRQALPLVSAAFRCLLFAARCCSTHAAGEMLDCCELSIAMRWQDLKKHDG